MVSTGKVVAVIGIIATWAVIGGYLYLNYVKNPTSLDVSPSPNYTASCTQYNDFQQCMGYGTLTTVTSVYSTYFVNSITSTSHATSYHYTTIDNTTYAVSKCVTLGLETTCNAQSLPLGIESWSVTCKTTSANFTSYNQAAAWASEYPQTQGTCQIITYHSISQFTSSETQPPSANNVTIFLALLGGKLASVVYSINSTNNGIYQNTLNGNQSRAYQLPSFSAGESMIITLSSLAPTNTTLTAVVYLIVDGNVRQSQIITGQTTQAFSWTI